MGATHSLDPSNPDFTTEVLRITQGEGFAFAIDAVGSPRVVEQAVSVAAPGATILLFGVANPESRVEVSSFEIYTKELSLFGTALNPFTHRRAASIVDSLGLDRLRVATFPRRSFAEAFEVQRSGAYDKVFISE